MVVVAVLIISADASKYSKHANEQKENKMNLVKPFRMNKLNLFWEKANKVTKSEGYAA